MTGRHRCAADARAFATTTVPAEVLSGRHVGVRSGLPDDHRELVGQPSGSATPLNVALTLTGNDTNLTLAPAPCRR